MLPWVVAAACAIAFIWLWFTIARRELTVQRDAVNAEQIQLQLVREQMDKLEGTPHEAAARERLDAENALYQNVQALYTETRQKPLNRLPAWVFGFRPVSKNP